MSGVALGASPVILWAHVLMFVAGLALAWCGLSFGAWLLFSARARRRHGSPTRAAMRGYWRRNPAGPLPQWAPTVPRPRREP